MVLAGNRLVTTGYGKDTAEAKVDLIANGFTLDGAIDRSFGTNGTTRVDVAGEDDRGRNLVALPDGRTSWSSAAASPRRPTSTPWSCA